MPDSIQDRLLRALLVAMRPIARALIQSGIGYREFAAVAKAAFVQVATDEYGVRGRPTNLSRVAVITGLSRKEVGKIRLKELSGESGFVREPPAASVLHFWTTDSNFIDANGNPQTLQFSEGQNSFSALVRASAGDIPPGALRTELLRVGAVRETASKELMLVKRHYVPMGNNDRLKHGLESAIWSIADTIAFNSDPSIGVAPRFQRVVSADGIDPLMFSKIQIESSAKLEEFAETYDDYLSKLEAVYKCANTESQVGIGLYYYQFYKKN